MIKKILRYLQERCLKCGKKLQYGSFGYGCGYMFCPECDSYAKSKLSYAKTKCECTLEPVSKKYCLIPLEDCPICGGWGEYEEDK